MPDVGQLFLVVLFLFLIFQQHCIYIGKGGQLDGFIPSGSPRHGILIFLYT